VLLGLAAGLAASLAVVLIPRVSGPVPTAWTDIANATGAERTVVARLSAQNEYRPLSSPTRTAPEPAARSNFRLEAVAARLRDEAHKHATVDNLHAVGVAELVLGRTDDALKMLLAAAAFADAGAGVYADLAAVHVARARRNAAGAATTTDWPSAVAAAERACALDAGLAAAWFNRALALEGLGRQVEARQAWQDYTTRFTADDGWRAEALAHMNPGVR
jgi:tetratricopeptide (TPR) repeat protein